jgi:polar amino acid transport system permease protein
MRRRFVAATPAVRTPLRALVWVLNAITRFCIEVFRGIPVVITIVFVWVGLPRLGVHFASPLGYLVIGLTIYNGVVIGEILRSGMEGLPFGQREAADALGLTPLQSIRLVLLPQAFRIIVPPLGNEFNLMMKSTSLLSVIGLQEMFLTAQSINSATFKTFEIFLTVAAYYLLLTTVWAFVQKWIERKMGAPAGSAPKGGTLRDRLLGGGRGREAAIAPQPAGSKE